MKNKILAACLVLSLIGCDSGQDDRKPKENSDKQTIVVDGHTVEADKDKRVKVHIKKYQHAKSQGPSVRTSSDEVVQSIDASAPESSLKDSFATGGMYKFFSEMKQSTSSMIFYVVGSIVFVGGLIFAIWSPVGRIKGVLAMAGGVSLAAVGLVFEQYPMVALVPVIGLIGVAGYFIYSGIRKDKITEVNRRIVKGIDNASKNGKVRSAAEIKEEIAKQDSDGLVKKEVSKVKSKL